MIPGDSACDLSLPPPLAKRGPPPLDPLLAALQIHTPWADVCSEQGTLGMRAPWQRVRPLDPGVLGMGQEASRWLRIWLVLKDVPRPTQGAAPLPSLTEPPTPPHTQGLSALSHPPSRAEQDSALFKEEMDTVLSALQAFPLTLTSAQSAECF